MDTRLSLRDHFQGPHFFKSSRADISEIRMKSFTVVEHFNVVDDVPPGLFPGFIVGKKYPLCFQAAEETLSNSIVPAISLATHAALHAIALQ